MPYMFHCDISDVLTLTSAVQLFPLISEDFINNPLISTEFAAMVYEPSWLNTCDEEGFPITSSFYFGTNLPVIIPFSFASDALNLPETGR